MRPKRKLAFLLVFLWVFTIGTQAQEQEPMFEGRPMSFYLDNLKKGACSSSEQSGLKAIGKPAVPGLLEIISDKTAKGRNCALMILSYVPDTRSLPVVVDALQESVREHKPYLYEMAVNALGSVLHMEHEQSLIDAKSQSRMKNYQHLIPILLNCLREVVTNLEMRPRGSYADNNTASALAAFGPLGIKPLTEVAQNPQEPPLMRVWTITALGFMGREAIDARPALRALIANQAGPAIVRGEAERALRSIEGREREP